MAGKKIESSISSEDKVYIVEKIMDDRKIRGKVELNIKWEGYPHSDNTWEPEENIPAGVIANYYKKKKAAEESAIKAKINETKKPKVKREVIKVTEKKTNSPVISLKKNTQTESYVWEKKEIQILSVQREKKNSNFYLYAYVDFGTYKKKVPLEEAHKKCPFKLIEFYENNLSFD